MANTTHSAGVSPTAVHIQPAASVPMEFTQAHAAETHATVPGHQYSQDEKGQRQFVNQNSTWAHSLFSCFDNPVQCLTSCCCPCIVYGRKQQRLANPSAPTALVNGHCIAYAALAYCGFAFLLGCTGRQNEREQFGIKGSAAGDCLTAYCCGCCALIQEEKEIDARVGRAIN